MTKDKIAARLRLARSRFEYILEKDGKETTSKDPSLREVSSMFNDHIDEENKRYSQEIEGFIPPTTKTTHATIDSWEKGKSLPTLQMLGYISSFYDIDPAELITGNKRKNTMEEESLISDYSLLEKGEKKTIQSMITGFLGPNASSLRKKNK